MPRSEERGGMAARSEAEENSLLVHKSPAWKGGVLYLGCQELLQTGSFLFLHLKKPHPKLEFQGPSNCSGSNGDGSSLSRSLELYGEEGAALYRKIADDLAATNTEVVHDP